MSILCLVVAIVLFVIAFLIFAGVATVTVATTWALVALGLAFFAAAHLPLP